MECFETDKTVYKNIKIVPLTDNVFRLYIHEIFVITFCGCIKKLSSQINVYCDRKFTFKISHLIHEFNFIYLCEKNILSLSVYRIITFNVHFIECAPKQHAARNAENEFHEKKRTERQRKKKEAIM